MSFISYLRTRMLVFLSPSCNFSSYPLTYPQIARLLHFWWRVFDGSKCRESAGVLRFLFPIACGDVGGKHLSTWLCYGGRDGGMVGCKLGSDIAICRPGTVPFLFPFSVFNRTVVLHRAF